MTADSKDALEIDLARGEAAWLNEADGKRLKLLERLSDATVTANEDSKKASITLKEDAKSDGAAWAKHCLQVMLAMNKGETLEAPAVQAAPDSVITLKIPKDTTGYIAGRQGARLKELADDANVIACFVKEVKPIVEKPLVIEVGALVEAEFEDNRWFEAEIKKVDDDKVTVRWTYDDDVPNSVVSKKDVRALPAKADVEDGGDEPLVEGALVEAKFKGGERMFEAKIMKIDGKKVTVKWTYDDDIPTEKIDECDIKRKPKQSIEKLCIYGYGRGALETQLKIMNLVDSKSAGYVRANAPPLIDERDTAVGFCLMPLVNNGEFKGKCVGKSGAMRKKICKVCESALEYPGNDAFILGDGRQRAQTIALLQIVQSESKADLETVPKALEDACSRVVLTDAQSQAVMGPARANMNYVEEQTGTISFWVLDEKDEKKEDKPDFTPAVGEIYDTRFKKPKGDSWFEAKVLEIVKKDDGDKYKMEWQYDPDEEKSLVSISDLRKAGSAPTKPAKGADRVLAIFGPEEKRKAASLLLDDLMAGKDIWPKGEKSSWGEEPDAKRPRVEYVVTNEEEERRKKRAARFAVAK